VKIDRGFLARIRAFLVVVVRSQWSGAFGRDELLHRPLQPSGNDIPYRLLTSHGYTGDSPPCVADGSDRGLLSHFSWKGLGCGLFLPRFPVVFDVCMKPQQGLFQIGRSNSQKLLDRKSSPLYSFPEIFMTGKGKRIVRIL
jgi:hypothetical protein